MGNEDTQPSYMPPRGRHGGVDRLAELSSNLRKYVELF